MEKNGDTTSERLIKKREERKRRTKELREWPTAGVTIETEEVATEMTEVTETEEVIATIEIEIEITITRITMIKAAKCLAREIAKDGDIIIKKERL